MPKPTFKVNGTEYIHLIAENGIKWARNDLDSDKSGRTLDGKMHRNRVTTKIRLDVTCVEKIKHEDFLDFNNAIYPATVKVQYLDPLFGLTTKEFYGSTINASPIYYKGKTTYWTDISFSITEV